MAECPACGGTMPSQDLCWLHDDLWDPNDPGSGPWVVAQGRPGQAPRSCRLCCPHCREEGEAANDEMPGTLIFCWPMPPRQ